MHLLSSLLPLKSVISLPTYLILPMSYFHCVASSLTEHTFPNAYDRGESEFEYFYSQGTFPKGIKREEAKKLCAMRDGRAAPCFVALRAGVPKETGACSAQARYATKTHYSKL